MYTRVPKLTPLIPSQSVISIPGASCGSIKKTTTTTATVNMAVLKSHRNIEDCAAMASDFDPPISVAGMKVLERAEFNKLVSIPALKIDAKHCSRLRKGLSRILLKQPRIKDVIPAADSKTTRLVLLCLHMTDLNGLKNEEKTIIEETEAVLLEHKFPLTYEHYTADQVLSAIMPAGAEVTTAFETIGHIAHMNLKEHQLQYKHLIGQVILDKNPSIKTVVNKTNTIEETFRFFHMELLAGEDRLFAKLKQHDCRFEFDFSKVYWNSRLQTEHKRIIDLLKSGDVVCDVFAGVGPFAIPAAKKGCKVHANDLNPESYKALKHNAKINRVEKNIFTYNMDGREFIRKCFTQSEGSLDSKEQLDVTDGENKVQVKHVLMNLPGNAVEFLDVFREFLEQDLQNSKNGTFTKAVVHCYCFSKSEDPFEDARNKVKDVLNTEVSNSEVHYVRNVAPKKAMMCISFQLNLKSLTEGKSVSENREPVSGITPVSPKKRGLKRPAEDQ